MKTLKLILMASILLCASCDKDNARRTYYKTIGEGYIYDGTNNKPLEGATITVISAYGSEMLWHVPTVEETFTTDKNGYFKVKFVKRVGGDKVTKYTFSPSMNLDNSPPPYWIRTNPGGTFPDIGIYPEDIKDTRIITFDTIKYFLKDS
ncbi:MAG: pollen Ole e 1 allergen/extensin family protein [Bacteroidales bacterium]|jgi:hypothetical protein|nr:pollen Ole e 1 allergen/extensin family protein [Bacteroidales bacterium]